VKRDYTLKHIIKITTGIFEGTVKENFSELLKLFLN